MKSWINFKVKIAVFFHYAPLLLKRGMSMTQFNLFIKRLLLFLSKLQHNKFQKMPNGIRLDLYVPSFSSRAFYTACDKFKIFGEKLPCTGVLLSVTSACMYNCKHCYQRLDRGKDTDIDLLIGAAKKLQDMGVAFFNIEGGEPFLRFDRLKAVCDVIDDRSEIWVNSTGYGMTLDNLRQLKISAVMFSLHSPDIAEFNEFMGHNEAWSNMENGIELCHKLGIPVAFNACLMKDAFYNGAFEKIMDIAKEKGASIIQIIKPKPSGAWLSDDPAFFNEHDLEVAIKKINEFNLCKKYYDYPAISAQIIEEDPAVFGCTAGGTDRFYINAKGDVQPCEFLNISFGNIIEEKFEDIYSKMRSCFQTPGTCMLCEKMSAKISGLFKDNNLSVLPLTTELSKQVYESWETGEPTDLYKKMNTI